MVYCTYNYGFPGGYKPTYNWGAPHCSNPTSIIISASSRGSSSERRLEAPQVKTAEGSLAASVVDCFSGKPRVSHKEGLENVENMENMEKLEHF